jgi:hypothetical protein
MKKLVKLNKSVFIVIALITSLCLHSNYAHSQSIREIRDKVKQAKEEAKKIKDDIKKAAEEAKKIKDDAKKQVQDVKNVTGAGGNGSGGTNGDSRGGTNGNSGTTGNSGNGGSTGTSGSSENNNANTSTGLSNAFNINQDFVKKVTITNLTAKKIILSVHLQDDGKDIGGYTRNPIECEAGKETIIDFVSLADRGYRVYNAEGETVTKTVSEKGKYMYNIQANYVDGYSKGDGTIMVSYTEYDGEGLKKLGNNVKIVKTAASDAELAKIEKHQQGVRDANDPTKLGTITIVNAVGGKGKIYCVLEVPSKQNSSKVTKMEFMLGENKGDKYVIKNLRLFDGYRLNSMPESEKAKDPARDGILFITNSLSGNSMDSFKMEDGLIGNVGVGMNR